jgi:hypothetical protein
MDVRRWKAALGRTGLLSVLCVAGSVWLQAQETGVLALEFPLPADAARKYREFARQGGKRTQKVSVSLTDHDYQSRILGFADEVTVTSGKAGLMVRSTPFLVLPVGSKSLNGDTKLKVLYTDEWISDEGKYTVVGAADLGTLTLTKAERETFAEVVETKGAMLFAEDKSEPKFPRSHPIAYEPLGITVEDFKKFQDAQPGPHEDKSGL